MNSAILILAISFLSYFEARNQVANFVLEPPEEGAEVKPEKPDLTVRAKCPACEGAGTLNLEEPDYGQFDGRIGSKTRKKQTKCPLCGGSGRHDAYVDPASLSMQVAQDRDAFVSAHQGRGELPVGLAFVPRDSYDGADRASLKLVENAYGKPCKCNWTGLEACRKCSGRGTVKCTSKDCKGGWEVTTLTTGVTETRSGSGSGIRNHGSNSFRSSSRNRSHTRKETKTSVKICPVCNGAKMLACPGCAGRKAEVCKRCSGLGYKQTR